MTVPWFFLAFLLPLLPLGVYLLFLGALHRRQRPLLMSGVWDLIGHLHPAEELTGASGTLVAVADAGHDGLLLAASREDQLTTWHSATGQLRQSWNAGHGELRAVVCSSDCRKVFTAGRDGTVIKRYEPPTSPAEIAADLENYL